MDDDGLPKPVVLDNGSGLMKVGFGDDDAPVHIFPSIVGRLKTLGICQRSECFVGEEANVKRGLLKLKYPIEHGMITNWNDVEKIWQHAISGKRYDESYGDLTTRRFCRYFNGLRICEEDHPLLMTEAPLTPRNDREKMTSICFETLKFPRLYVANHAVMSLISTGRVTGVVVESGDGVTHTVPIFEGYSLPHAVLRMNIAGRDMTDYMVRILHENRSIEMTTSYEREMVRKMKEAKDLCYVSQDFEADMSKSKSHPEEYEIEYTFKGDQKEQHKLPDNNTIKIGSERFMCPEIIFKPHFIGAENLPGVHETTFNSINKVDVDMRRELYRNIVVSGGSTLFNGFVERMAHEIQELAQSHLRVKVSGSSERGIGAWIGGSIFSKMSSMESMWITRTDYDDVGAGIVHRKCL